jgi:hypothetical protein
MRPALVAFAAIAMYSPPSLAGPPNAALSDVDPCIFTCPSGNSAFTAIIREANGAPTEPDRDTELDRAGLDHAEEPAAPSLELGAESGLRQTCETPST